MRKIGDGRRMGGNHCGLSQRRRRLSARATAVVGALWVMGVPVGAWAMAPPVEFALEAVGQKASERADQMWAMTKVERGVVELCGERIDEDGEVKWRFVGDDSQVTMGPDAQAPWGFVWSVLWSPTVDEALSSYIEDWGEETGRIEVVDGAPGYCYGEETRLCVDEKLRRIEVLEVEVEGTRWTIRGSAAGQRLQVSEDGAQVARLRSDQACDP